MALLTVTINDPGLDKKSAEIGFLLRALQEVEKELGRGNGSITSGTILSHKGPVGNQSLGSWTYTSSAPNP